MNGKAVHSSSRMQLPRDRQFKDQFIHVLNDKHMLEEIIKELTATSNDDHITSGGVLAWAKEWRHKECRQQC